MLLHKSWIASLWIQVRYSQIRHAYLDQLLQYFCHVWSSVCCRIGTVYCTDRCSISVPIAAVFLPRLELSLLQNRDSLLYRSLQYFCTDRCSISATSGLSLLQIWNSLLYRSLQYFCTNCCSISATSGAQFAAESGQFTVPIAAVFLYRSLQYFCTPLDRYPRSLHTTVDSQPICD